MYKKITNLTIRTIHLSLGLSFLIAYITAESERWKLWHITSGYVLIGLIAFRFIYYLISYFVLKNQQTNLKIYLNRSLQLITHVKNLNILLITNSLIAISILGMFLFGLFTVITGYIVEEEIINHFPDDLHEFFGNGFLSVILIHILLIAFVSIKKKNGYWLQMFTGKIKGSGKDLIKKDNALLSIFILLIIGSFVYFQFN